MKRQIFKIPENFLDKIFEFTGSDQSSRGFMLTYINSENSPVVYARLPNAMVEMSLTKAMEEFLKNKGGGLEEITGEDQDLE